jgi:hypothetical protein
MPCSQRKKIGGAKAVVHIGLGKMALKQGNKKRGKTALQSDIPFVIDRVEVPCQ